MKGIIINADDFGLSEGVCDAIKILLDTRCISSTSLMLCAPKAFELIPKYNIKQWEGSVGIHLQLTSGECLSEPNEVASLVLSGTRKFKDPRKGAVPNIYEVEKEWRNQIKAGMALLEGIPSHIDSHHGVHRIPELFDLYMQLANEIGVQIRGTIGQDVEKMLLTKTPGTIALVRNWTGKKFSKEELLFQITEIRDNFPNEQVLELIIHPGYCDDYLRSISSLSDARENDFNVIKELASKNWLSELGLKLISRKEAMSQYGTNTRN